MKFQPTAFACPTCGRSSYYCFDVARGIAFPQGIWHKSRIDLTKQVTR